MVNIIAEGVILFTYFYYVVTVSNSSFKESLGNLDEDWKEKYAQIIKIFFSIIQLAIIFFIAYSFSA